MKEFSKDRHTYEDFTKKMELLIRDLLSEEHFKTHTITSRTKEIESLKEKIEEEEKYYEKLNDVTDLTGVRITCLFSDDVDKVAKIINDNFTVHTELSVDKRKMLDPDRFGYLSLHYIVELPDDRVNLREFIRFKGLMCEIQIRSILQHAWAEIEHNFGYKSSISIPKDIRRKFALQAGLLELADEQFVVIKNDIREYKKKIKGEISRSYVNISIDGISVKDYIEHSELIKRIDTEIGVSKNLTQSPSSMTDGTVQICEYFKIKTIDELDKKILEKEGSIIKFVKQLDSIPNERGHSIWYFGYMLAAQNKKIEQIMDYLTFVSVYDGDERLQWAEEVLDAYKKIN